MQFVVADYFATGEGRTIMLLITKAYGPSDPETNAREQFAKLFGDYFAIGAEIITWEDMKKDYENFLPPAILKYMNNPDAPGFSWHTSFHFNYS